MALKRTRAARMPVQVCVELRGLGQRKRLRTRVAQSAGGEDLGEDAGGDECGHEGKQAVPAGRHPEDQLEERQPGRDDQRRSPAVRELIEKIQEYPGEEHQGYSCGEYFLMPEHGLFGGGGLQFPEEGEHHVEHGSEVSFAGGRIFQRVALIGNRGKESTCRC